MRLVDFYPTLLLPLRRPDIRPLLFDLPATSIVGERRGYPVVEQSSGASIRSDAGGSLSRRVARTKMGRSCPRGRGALICADRSVSLYAFN